MKKIVILLIIMAMIITPSMAEVVSFEGGLVGDPTLTNNQFNYQEVLFITGEPIVMTGTVQVPTVPENTDQYTITYNYELLNSDKNVEVDRTATFQVTKTSKEEYGQTTYKYELTSLDETINVAGTEYVLNSFLYNRSMIYDNTAAVDYFSGNMYLKRTYYTGGTPENYNIKVTIEITSNHDEGAMIGYDHLWGNAETYMSKMTLNGEVPNPDYDSSDPDSEEKLEWYGQVDLRSSYQKFSEFQYQSTAPQSISFVGSYVRIDEIENVFQYTYDMPVFENNLPTTKRNTGEETLRNDKIIDGDSMVVPHFKDTGGHWGEDNIFFLASLEVINNKSEFYGPDQPLTRIEFAEMISNAIATIEDRSQTEIIRSLRPGATQMFNDIPNDYEFYNYVAFVYNNDIMNGYGNYFNPEDKISRAEVITIMVNALGLENRAPQLPFETRYSDDADIPNWSKRFIYMADEINLVSGFPDNTIKPNAHVTRAEGSAMIKSLIDHMKDNIRIDYREKIINRY
ncbi:S-layer homology domain-containing protein [Acidaminobacter sp. JC074]|uniref:S-layer homology domain-containing protein n=1 Tax=Acidaminobacter sp. JC074 TaxID=2530199 RepID=UPI001F0CF600|nr:S-layer homology domain-containing protein [Acidaminobacter sp. JC074]